MKEHNKVNRIFIFEEWISLPIGVHGCVDSKPYQMNGLSLAIGVHGLKIANISDDLQNFLHHDDELLCN